MQTIPVANTEAQRSNPVTTKEETNIKANFSVKSKRKLTSSDPIASIFSPLCGCFLTMSTEQSEATYTDFEVFIAVIYLYVNIAWKKSMNIKHAANF